MSFPVIKCNVHNQTYPQSLSFQLWCTGTMLHYHDKLQASPIHFKEVQLLYCIRVNERHDETSALDSNLSQMLLFVWSYLSVWSYPAVLTLLNYSIIARVQPVASVSMRLEFAPKRTPLVVDYGKRSIQLLGSPYTVRYHLIHWYTASPGIQHRSDTLIPQLEGIIRLTDDYCVMFWDDDTVKAFVIDLLHL